MNTVFISDLHLSQSRPETTGALVQFLATNQHDIDRLYILGDMFDMWLGHDYEPALNQQIQAALAPVSEVFFIRGNRDIAMRPDAAKELGMQMLEDETVIDCDGQRVLLCHGDLLCSDDEDYQQKRKMLAHESSINEFLQLPLQGRLDVAQYHRGNADAAKSMKSSEIMDVNQDTVQQKMHEHAVQLLIHGHTHRPAVHHFKTADQTCQRYVLGAWESDTHILICNNGAFNLEHIPLASATPAK